MKGKATITLSDAKTGKVIQQAEEHNLVTNALRNVFNPPHYALLHGFDYSLLFKYGLPMWNELLGGIMLLGNTEEENADNIMLGADIIPVATAGKEYAGSCVTRGTLNLNESYETENGYHFTWDFGTDKANGTIRCICLTSKLFGNTGFGADSKNESGLFMSPNKLGAVSSTTTMTFEYGEGLYVGTYDGLHTYMHLTSAGTLEFRRYTGLVPSALHINDRAGLSTVSAPVSVTTVPLDVTVRYEDRCFINASEKTVCYFGAFTTTDASTTVSYTILNIETAEAVTRTVTLAKKLSDYGAHAVFGDNIYILSSDGINVFSMDGALKKVIALSPSSSCSAFEMNGCLWYNTNANTYMNVSWGGIELAHGFNGYPVGVGPLYPYTPVASRNSHVIGGAVCKNKASLVVAAGYKATINNLSSPIEKTTEHTLKISYDISC